MTIRNLLTRGNGKLGEGVHAWSIPAVETCPGRSAACEAACYATRGRFRTRRMKDRLAGNLEVARLPGFARRVAAEIRRRGVHVLRVHVAGDFFSAEYARQWLEVARRCRRTTLYAYTRSWRNPEIAPALAELAMPRNVRLWYSCDSDTGPPAGVPPGVRLAWLQHEPGEAPARADLVFRVERLRRPPTTRVGLAVVCASETGLPAAAGETCTSCRRCYR